MKTNTIKQLISKKDYYNNKTVTLSGWIRSIRKSKNICFIDFYDGSYFSTIQVVILNLDDSQLKQLIIGACLFIEGIFMLTLNGKQPYEITANRIKLLGASNSDYPIQKKKLSFEYLRSIAHLRPRTNTFSAVFKVRSIITEGIQLFLKENDFVYITSPCITSSDCEGSGETFAISTLDYDYLQSKNCSIDYSQDFFSKKTSLSVSGQLHLEPFCMIYRNVYTLGPSFRAEKSNTTRHAAEFWQVEPEMAFYDLNDTIELIEALVKYVINYVLKNAKEEMLFFDKYISPGKIKQLQNTIDFPFEIVTYTKAIDILKEHQSKFEHKIYWGIGIQTEFEKFLADQIFKKPVFITDYPKDKKAFYMKLNDDNKTVAATDLIFPEIGEVVGASQREESYEKLKNRLIEKELDINEYEWYLDLRKYGSCIHSGFGLGIERFTRFITGIENIRDVIPFPRTPNSIKY